MKKNFLVSVIAVVGTLTFVNLSPSVATVLEEALDPLTLIKGRTHRLDDPSADGALELTFSRVLAESRCPPGVQCIWAGEVGVELVFEKNGTVHREKLVLPGAGDPKPRELHGYRLTLLEVHPYPELDRPEPAPEDVKIVISIEGL